MDEGIEERGHKDCHKEDEHADLLPDALLKVLFMFYARRERKRLLCPSIWPYVSMSVLQYASVTVCQYVNMSVCQYVSVNVSVCQYVSLSV